MRADILVVEDEAAMRDLIVEDIAERGWQAVGVSTATEAISHLRSLRVGALVTDMNLGAESGIWLCRRAHEIDPELPVIVITAFGSLESAIDAIRAGAYDFVTKPFRPEQLALVLSRALRLRSLQREVSSLRQDVLRQQKSSQIDGLSPAIHHLRESISLVATTDAPVLLVGESGTGKDRVAREIHELSRRRTKPFVAENVAAVPASLAESTLFGHVKGAFTGAAEAREGLFRTASGGTFLLDEIGELPLDLQAKLLRVLEEGKVRPVGSDQSYPFDARVVAATHRDLTELVKRGQFREDLYYRLAVIEIPVPPLRERGRDILLLAQKFLEGHAEQLGKDIRGLHPSTAAKLLGWHWPGNVRELRNVVQRAVVMARQPPWILPVDLPERMAGEPTEPLSAEAEALLPLEEVERRHIIRVLKHTNNNKTEAARILGVGRKTLYRKLEAWGLATPEEPS